MSHPRAKPDIPSSRKEDHAEEKTDSPQVCQQFAAGQTGGTNEGGVAVGVNTGTFNYNKYENICSMCMRNLKRIGDEGDGIDGLIQKQRHLFKKSRSFHKVKEKLKEKRVVVVTGAPAEGKTTLAVQMCDWFKKNEGRRGHYVNLRTLHSKLGSEGTLTIIDNMFEGERFSTEKEILEVIDGDKTTSLFIIVCQLFNLKRAQRKLNFEILCGEHVVNISDINCSVEDGGWCDRYNVLESVCTSLSTDKKTKIAQSTPFLIGFVGMCAFYHETERITCLFYPQSFYLNQFSAIIDKYPYKAALFIYMMFCKGEVKMAPISDNNFDKVKKLFKALTIDTLKEEVDWLIGTYLKHSGQNVVFMYPILYESCVAAIINCYPEYMREHFEIQSQEEDCTATIYVKAEQNLTAEAGEKNCTEMAKPAKPVSVVNGLPMSLVSYYLLNMLKSRQFCKSFKHPLLLEQDISDNVIRSLKSDYPSIFKRTDIDQGGSFLFWSGSSKNEQVVLDILNNFDVTEVELNDSIIDCVERDCLYGLDALKGAVGKCQKEITFNINFTQSHKTPLMLASMNGQTEMADRLLKLDADPSVRDDKGRNCVHLAAAGGYVKTFEALLKKVPDAVLSSKDHNGITPSQLASGDAFQDYNFSSASGHEKNNMATELVTSACLGETNSFNRLLKGTVNGHETCSDGNTPVMIAALYGSFKVFNHFADTCDISIVNAERCNILHNACIGGSLQIVKYIDEHSKDRRTDLNRENKKGESPAMTAAYMAHSDVFQFLVDKGYELTGQKTTALHAACRGGSTDIVEIIFDRGLVDTNRKDCDGKTPLDLATEHGHHDVVELLNDELHKHGPVFFIETMEASCRLSCPHMELDRDRVHEDLSVSESGELTNVRGSWGDQRVESWGDQRVESWGDQHVRKFYYYFGTCTRLPLPPSPSTLSVPRYWESQSRLRVTGDVSGLLPLLDLGVAREEEMDSRWLSDQPGAWNVEAVGCTRHPDICTEVWEEGRRCGDHHRNSLSPTPGTGVQTIHWGVVVGRGRVGFLDVTRGRVLHRFDVNITDDLRPMFSVWPDPGDCEIHTRLLSGAEISMDENKQSLIAKALFG